MMNVSAAIKGLDGYAEALASLTAMLNLFAMKSDQHEALLAQIKQKQADGRWLAIEIMKDIHNLGTKADGSGDLTGIGAAMQRYVAADDQANEALKKKDEARKPSAIAEAINRFREENGLDRDTPQRRAFLERRERLGGPPASEGLRGVVLPSDTISETSDR